MGDNGGIVGPVQSGDTSVLGQPLLVPMSGKACKHLRLPPSAASLAYVRQMQFQWALK